MRRHLSRRRQRSAVRRRSGARRGIRSWAARCLADRDAGGVGTAEYRDTVRWRAPRRGVHIALPVACRRRGRCRDHHQHRRRRDCCQGHSHHTLHQTIPAAAAEVPTPGTTQSLAPRDRFELVLRLPDVLRRLIRTPTGVPVAVLEEFLQRALATEQHLDIPVASVAAEAATD